MKKLNVSQMENLQGEGWKCYLGSAGMAITGGLAGGAAGSVIPVLGTTAGAVWGALGGAMTGMATFC